MSTNPTTSADRDSRCALLALALMTSSCAGVDAEARETETDAGTEDVAAQASDLQFCIPWREVCNGIDDDCNGIIDDNIPHAGFCGSDVGECTPGILACSFGRFVCTGRGPRSERCDRRDNDCDGVVDEGVRNRCGQCGPNPRERCDYQDNDCDGAVDEGINLNTDNFNCGACNQRCAVEEFCDNGRCELDPAYFVCDKNHHDWPRCEPH